MAKKVERKDIIRTHKDCKHCVIVTDRFLSNKGEPLMGRCAFYEHLFLLNEKINCNDYDRRKTTFGGHQ